MYQYRPQNEDELELREGDRVDVMQRCDDGWFVGTTAGLWGRCAAGGPPGDAQGPGGASPALLLSARAGSAQSHGLTPPVPRPTPTSSLAPDASPQPALLLLPSCLEGRGPGSLTKSGQTRTESHTCISSTRTPS